MARTLYEVLMLSPLADARVITLVYRHLAKRYHPDVDDSPAAAARMAELNEAYATLSDPDRRARYDGSIGLEPAHPDVWRERTAPARASSTARERGPRVEPSPGPGTTPPGTTPPGTTPPGTRPSSATPQAPGSAAVTAAETAPYGEAGPPPANPAPAGSRLTFGRYRGWALNQVGRVDRDYLEWLSRTTMGRTYRRELDELLRRR